MLLFWYSLSSQYVAIWRLFSFNNEKNIKTLHTDAILQYGQRSLLERHQIVRNRQDECSKSHLCFVLTAATSYCYIQREKCILIYEILLHTDTMKVQINT